MCWHGDRAQVHDERRAYRPPDGVRVSDADRQRVIDQLQTHTADGRLTLDEFEARVGEAWRAATHGELRAVLRELPVTRAVAPARRPQRVGLGVPTPLLVAALVVAGSVLLGHFAWWLIPVGFFALGGCGGHRGRSVEEPRAARGETLISA